tara:strand:+ start:369 stop:1196 length:828 start_codon:yes stop_codon:yes gene_type:complete
MQEIIYYLYHIPGKKIGVTRNLNKRVTLQQGYASNEYEVLFSTKDIDEISTMEIDLQIQYGYPLDRTLYKNLFKKIMKVNATEQTTTFPVPLNKLKGQLLDSIGLEWSTPDDIHFKLTSKSVQWIMANVKKSMFSSEKCFIYNKALYEAFNDPEHTPATDLPEDESPNIYDLIRQWAHDKGIYKQGDVKTQYIKLMEEAGELAQAILKNDEAEFIDAIGDMVVVLTNLAALRDIHIEDCVTSAYDVIASRKGEMKNGTFVKEDVTSLNYHIKSTL